jgi:chitin disaccharide deacetylase
MKSPLSFGSAVLAAAAVFFTCSSGLGQQKTIAERLGYPADAKLLIVHADDLAVAHSVDTASFAALDQKAVSSASIMVPCPWLTEAAAYAKTHPDADLGLHLTLTSEWKSYRWAPVAPNDIVRGLLDGSGYLGREGVWVRATPDDVEREIRAQIERAIQMGIRPTHLDSHMGTVSFASNRAFFAVLVKVAHDYSLPFLANRVNDYGQAEMLKMLSDKDVVVDRFIMADASVPVAGWKEFYCNAVRRLEPGLTEIAVHLGHDDPELQAITEEHPNFSAAWRQRDFDVVTSPEFKRAIEENHAIVIGWKDLKRVM